MIGSPPTTPEQVSSLESSAQSSGGSTAVGSTVLPCQAWKLKVTVKSVVPYHPEGRVAVSANITSGGVGYRSERTMMDGPESPPVEFSGSGSLTYSLSGSADKWEAVRATSVSVSPRVEPFTATVEIKPKKPWAIVKVLDVGNDAFIPRFAIGLKLGTNTKAATTTKDQQSVFEELETAESDGRFSLISRARDFDVASLEHPDEVWEFVSISAT